MKITIRRPVESLSAFELKPELNQNIWDEDVELRPEVQVRLDEIANDFIEKLDLKGVEVKDVIITGSLANYNWSRYSDIDVHILIDFEEVDKNVDLVKRFFDALRSNWNKSHNIYVKGHEVELYIQDEEEPHTSTGVYSTIRNKWLVKPKPVDPYIDKRNVSKKARSLMREIVKIETLFGRGNFDAALADGQKLKLKLQKMRKAGLDARGIFSVENLAFKVLRRSGHMKRLYDTMREAYDMSMSLAD